VGIGLGVAAAIAATRVLHRLVDGMHGVDAATYAIVVAVLAASAMAASVVPARRACRVDAMTALRQD